MAPTRQSSHDLLITVAFVVAILWTIAAVVMLAYWSGLLFWLLVIPALASAVWMGKAFMRMSRAHGDAEPASLADEEGLPPRVGN
jgi:fatty acid desaturase